MNGSIIIPVFFLPKHCTLCVVAMVAVDVSWMLLLLDNPSVAFI